MGRRCEVLIRELVKGDEIVGDKALPMAGLNEAKLDDGLLL